MARRIFVATVYLAVSLQSAPSQPFQIEETTIAGIHAAIEARHLTCRALVQQYLDRIVAYDKHGPALNSIITINPNALASAGELDADFAKRGLTGPLHCIPFIVKDNFNTANIPTSAGSLALAQSVPSEDAFQVRKIRGAGAIVLAKANMSEFAISGVETVSSRLPGYTRNPYALDRVTAGSSGGTAAAVAANLGAVGLGTDTENSIRGPASHTSLVGIRSTMGLTSRAGIVPLDLDRDIGGPMARTVTDAVIVFDVIAGQDPNDPVTRSSTGRIPERGYASLLSTNGLRGARIGVLRSVLDPKTADAGVVRLFDRAVADLRTLGAETVDPLVISELEPSSDKSSAYSNGESMVWSRCSPFKFDLNNYLSSLGDRAPFHSLEEILTSRKFHPSVGQYMRRAQEVPRPPREDPVCEPVREGVREIRDAVLKALADHELDALVYPSWSNPPRLIGDLNSPSGMNSGCIASPTGFPAITVPMGYAHGVLPAGIELVGAPWSEPTLFKFAFAYEHGTHHRQTPHSVGRR
jgi:Asp-tRNA(Asn)/Glu-tRNA(Gln) amidotransferase A subunit family amidase